jgi:ribosome modulation factor
LAAQEDASIFGGAYRQERDPVGRNAKASGYEFEALTVGVGRSASEGTQNGFFGRGNHQTPFDNVFKDSCVMKKK